MRRVFAALYDMTYSMVKLRRMGNLSSSGDQSWTSVFFRTLRSVNARCAIGNSIAATCDFKLTRMNEVDYSLTKMVHDEIGGEFDKSGKVF